MLRYAIYSFILVAFIFVLGHGFNGVSASERSTPFLVMVGIIIAVILVLAVLWDRIDHRE